MKCSQIPKEHGHRCSYGKCRNWATHHAHWGTGCGHLCDDHARQMIDSACKQNRSIDVTKLDWVAKA